MTNYRSVVWLNCLFLLLVLLLIVCAKLLGLSAGELFRQPAFSPSPNSGLLTYTFQLLCSVPFIVCAFTFALLNKIQPRRPENLFILCSALLTGGFLINEIYRIHVHLLISAGIPKLLTSAVYAVILLGYGLTFRKQIKSTPYFPLLISVGLLFFAILVDSLHLSGRGIPKLLEGIPKLFSEINIALYFWYVCYQEVLRSLKASFRSYNE